MEKFYNLTNDYLFKEVFRKEKFLILLLNDFFKINCSKINYKNGETLRKNKIDKYGTIDILIEIDNNINCILEMQKINEYNFKERMLFYGAKIISNKGLEKKENYKDLKKTIVLAIVDFNDKEYKSFMKAALRDNEGKIFTKKLDFRIINLSKFENKKDSLYKLFKCKSLKEIEEYKEDEKYNEIYEMIRYYNLDKEEKEKMDELAKYLEDEKRDYDGMKEWAKEQGLRQGLKEGIQEGRKEGIQEGRKEGIQEGRKEGRKEGIQEGRKEGIREGRKEGIREGRKEGICAVALNLLRKHVNLNEISEVTNMSVAELEKLKMTL